MNRDFQSGFSTKGPAFNIPTLVTTTQRLHILLVKIVRNLIPNKHSSNESSILEGFELMTLANALLVRLGL